MPPPDGSAQVHLQAPTVGHPTISVVIACYTEARWDGLTAAVRSVLDQSRPPEELVVAVDHEPALLRRVQAELPGVRAVLNTGARGASGTRNAGAAVAGGDVLAFLDDDTSASRTWLADLVGALVEVPGAVGAGGRVDGSWPDGVAPGWFPPEFLWVVGVTHEGMPRDRSRVRNVWSENMALWRTAFTGAGGFRDGFGKLASDSRPEDTELCIRVARLTGHSWLYVPAAEVTHSVPAVRATWRFFVRRCYAEGRGKADMTALHDGGALADERSHLLVTIPRGVLRDLGRALTGDRWGVPRAVTAAVGVLAAGWGFLTARTSRPLVDAC
jgi:glucosyl-dolichyl phosphate glucuronosyltransferase